jgi:hypothetical protein
MPSVQWHRIPGGEAAGSAQSQTLSGPVQGMFGKRTTGYSHTMNGEQGTDAAMAKKAAPSLESRKDLILHTYDLFLISQTRLFVQARSNEGSDSNEINRRRELLLLDDLTGFAIAARRLVELTGLKSFANRCLVPMVYLDQAEEPYQVMKLDNKI